MHQQWTAAATGSKGAQIGSNTTNTCYFYYDPIADNKPTFGSTPLTTTIKTANFVQISGIWVLHTSIAFTATTMIASNIGNYFYNSTNILVYKVESSLASAITSVSIDEKTLTNATSSSGSVGYTGATKLISYPITFTNTGAAATGNIATTAYGPATIFVNVTAYNPKTATEITTYTATSSTNAYPVFIDQPSYALTLTTSTTYPTTPKSLPTTLATATFGMRVWTGDSANTITSTTTAGTTAKLLSVTSTRTGYVTASNIYDNAQSIIYTSGTGSNYNQDLQLCNGLYVAKSYTDAYKNYNNTYLKNNGTSNNFNTLDYSSNSSISSTGYRYATFVWQCAAASCSNVYFIINGFSTALNIPTTGTYQNIPCYTYNSATQPILIYYRFEDTAAFNVGGGAKFGSFGATAYYNTGWVNANVSSPPLSSSNYSSGNETGGLKSTATLDGTSKILTISAAGPSVTLTANVYLFCVIGLPMNTNLGFTSVKAYYA